LTEELAKKFKQSKRRADLLLNELALIAYREAPTGFTLPGICKMDVTRRKERRARNPQTGESLLIGAHDVLRVRPLKRAKMTVAPTPANLITILPPEAAAPAEAAPTVSAPPSAAAPQPAAKPAGAQATPELFSFNCPYCRVDIEVSSDVVGDRISCPGCERAFVVPPVGQQPKAEGQGAPAAKPAPVAKQAAAAKGAAPEEQFVSFLCKSCGQEIEAPIDMAGSQDECPACGVAILVPYVSEPGTSQALRSAAADPASIEAAMHRTLRIELPDEF
ncbi:MAG: HU family DNA-binding protein, partial [Kiritimatiellae bacterium]|nr:HU family DNA-binding protein [Kiritimatiellia bacterium]